MTTHHRQSTAHDEPQDDQPGASEVVKDTAVITAAWISGPHPAALAEIEVAEEIEPPTPVPTRTEGDGFEDHVRMYLREIGTVPLLTWDGEKRLARAMVDQPDEIDAEHLSRLIDDLGDLGQTVIALKHADGLRPLAGENEGELHNVTSEEPQVKPPPTPCSSTRCPVRILPARTYSSSASGTEAAEVLP